MQMFYVGKKKKKDLASVQWPHWTRWHWPLNKNQTEKKRGEVFSPNLG